MQPWCVVLAEPPDVVGHGVIGVVHPNAELGGETASDRRLARTAPASDPSDPRKRPSECHTIRP